jgi:gamma-butyrobetaine dioxygenase
MLTMNMGESETKINGLIRALTSGERTLDIAWSDGRTSSFHYLWLRDNCPRLLHASTNHRVVETSTISPNVSPASVAIDSVGALTIVWEHDKHESVYEAQWLLDHDYSNGVRHEPAPPKLWRANIGNDLPRSNYPELASNPQTRKVFLEQFVAYGVGVLHNVPNIPGTVLEVAALLGEIRSTSWGTVFDVISMEDANSVAYTNLPLVVHTDEGYRDPAPTVQLQHFLRADASGGASTLTDGFAVAEEMRVTKPEQFALLANTMLQFHFADDTAEHAAYLPTITLHPDGRIKAIRYSNHSVKPFLLPFDQMEAFYEAYQTFGWLRESDEFQLRIEMGAGDLYIVDNHRVMHGRTGFSSGGARHLQSCYIERDELVSRLTVLQR